jgi:hypothetical protein
MKKALLFLCLCKFMLVYPGTSYILLSLFSSYL